MNRAARRCRRLRSTGLAAGLLALALPALGAEPPPLVQPFGLFDGAVEMRTPEGWIRTALTGRPEAVELAGDQLLFRIARHASELPKDAFHAQCMMERQAPALELDAEVVYEYDYVGGKVAGRPALDSAYRVRYDEPLQGAREWRQRSLSVVGDGSSVCVVQMAPAREWKRSPRLRDLAAAVLSSLVLR